MKGINTNYFTKINIANLILRLFIDSRPFFSTMSNERNLREKDLHVSNIDATTTMLSTFQPIRGDDLPLELRSNTNKKIKDIFPENTKKPQP